jgi:hypothetical protein
LHHEDGADARVLAVYADVRRRLAFVPALFKALAADPVVLESAWLQARALLDDAGFPDALDRVRVVAGGTRRPRVSPAVRAAVAPFASDLPAMLLVAMSLEAALDGRIPRRAPVGTIEPGLAPPEPTVPEFRGDHPAYASIRSVYGTTHVPTLYRSLAALGLLEEAWPHASKLLTSAAGRTHVDRVAAAGRGEAEAFDTVGCFACEEARPIVEQLVIALPRNLVVAAALA